MALNAGKNVVFKITDAGSTERTLTSYVTKLSVNMKGHGLVDVTAGGDAGHTYASDELEDGSFQVDMVYDNTATTGPFIVIEGLRDATAATAFEIGIGDGTAGDTKLTGNCWIEDMSFENVVGDIDKMSVSIKVDGAYTVATY